MYYLMKYILIVALWCINSIDRITHGWSAFDCNGLSEWPIDKNDNDEASKLFQDWLTLRQNFCMIKNANLVYKTQLTGGFGYTIFAAAVDIIKAVELNLIFYPTTPWQWSNKNSSLCSRGISAVDCFTLPLSYCHTNKKVKHISIPSSNESLQINIATYLRGSVENDGDYLNNSALTINIKQSQRLIDGTADICTMSKTMKKPILWTLGQALRYVLRLPEPLQTTMNKQMDHYLNEMKRTKLSYLNEPSHTQCLTAAVHIRGGLLDCQRKPVNGQEHLKELYALNETLLKENKTICSVLLTSDNIYNTIFANVTLGKITDWNGLEVLALPRFTEFKDDLELNLGKLKSNVSFDTRKLFMDWYEDAFLSAHVDIYIGSHSNLFIVVSALRSALHPQLPNEFTCFLDSQRGNAKTCMGTSQMHMFWQAKCRGFNGGSMFFKNR